MSLSHKIIFIVILCVCIIPATTASPGIVLSSYPIDDTAGGTDNKATWNISVFAEGQALDNVTLWINTTDSDHEGHEILDLDNCPFSDNDFHLDEDEKKNVTLTMTIKYGTELGRYDMRIDGYGTWQAQWGPVILTGWATCWVNVTETVVQPTPTPTPPPPPPSPVAVPEFNVIGLVALIGILTIILAFATSRRKKE